MATFRVWLEAQEGRDDQVGYFARYWAQHSPGRISTPSGMQKTMNKFAQDISAMDDGIEKERADVNLKAALVGLGLALKDYHKDEAVDHALATGASPEDLAREPDKPAAARGPGWPNGIMTLLVEQNNEILVQLARLNMSLDLILRQREAEQRPDGIDWDLLMEMADFTAEADSDAQLRAGSRDNGCQRG